MRKTLLSITLMLVLMLTACTSGKEPVNVEPTQTPGTEAVAATSTPAEVSVSTPTPRPTATNTPRPTATPSATGTKPTATPSPVSAKATVTPAAQGSGEDLYVPEWRDMLAQMGTGWNLGNTMDAYTNSTLNDEMTCETMWVNAPKVSQKLIDKIKEGGFSTVRIPVSWHNHITKTVKEDGSTYYKISEKWLKRVHEIVDYCINDDLFVIINIHHDDAGAYYVYPDAAHEQSSLDYVTSIWEQIALEFGDYDYHVIFETLNEPRLTGASEWNPKASDAVKAQKYIDKFNQAAVDTIRATAGKYNGVRYIGCPGYAASIDSLDRYTLPKDPSGLEGRIMVSVHAYTPYDFATAKIQTFNSSVKSSVDWAFNTINNKLTSKNIPAYIGEWGVYAEKTNYDARLQYVDYYISSAGNLKDSSGKQIKIPTVIWDNGCYGKESENYAVLNRISIRWYEQDFVKAIIEAGK